MNTIALIRIWNHTQQHSGTSGARVCAAVLLGLYNGGRFPMDITDLRILDAHLLNDCLAVITADSVRCQKEVHEWLNCLSGRYDFGERFEALAHEYKTFAKGKCGKRGDYAHIMRLAIEEPTSKTIEAARADWEDAFNAEIKRAAPIMTGPVDIERRSDIGKPLSTTDIDALHRSLTTPFFNDLAG